MNCKIILTDDFKRDAKRLLKKYVSLKTELAELQEQILANPRVGTEIHDNVYKIRLAVKSKGKGKSGGLRVITYLFAFDETNKETNIYLISIYDKSESESINDSFLKNSIMEINQEIKSN